MAQIFPFELYWWFYLGFTAFIVFLLLLDLGIFHKKAHAVSFREALTSSIVWVALALGFNYALYSWASWHLPQDARLMSIPGFDPTAAARQIGLEFLTGYIVEKALAADNIFVFVLVFSYFGIPNQFQHRILFYGILGALVFRALFIAAGSVLMSYHWLVVFFGALLVFTGVKMFFAGTGSVDPSKNRLVRLLTRILPVTPGLEGDRFFVRQGGRLLATPLLLALVVVEASDIIFAVDSVPAIFAITKEPLIVFTSNIFAILGLRAMYFLLASVVEKFHLLKYALGVVLIFIGNKMIWLNAAFDGKFPILWSLLIIATTIGIGMALSLAYPARSEVTESNL